MNLGSEQAYCNTPNFPYNRRRFRDDPVICAVLQHSSRKYTESCRRMAAVSRLLDQVREATRRLHYSIRTEDTYVAWTKRFILFHGKRHPLEMGEPEVVAYLTHLAVQCHVAASTQNQALSALTLLVYGRPWPTSELARRRGHAGEDARSAGRWPRDGMTRSTTSLAGFIGHPPTSACARASAVHPRPARPTAVSL
jgi:hypothetical protein